MEVVQNNVIKRGIFHFFQEVVYNCSFPLVIYILLSIIETLQVIAVLLYIQYIKFQDVLPEYLEALHHAMVYLINLGSNNGFEIAQFVITSSCCFILIGACLIGIFKSSRNTGLENRSSNECLSSFVSFSLVVYKKILVFPICLITAQSFPCDSFNESSDCYGNLHIFLICFAAFIYVMVIVLSLLISYFFIDENPDSGVPWALCDNRISMMKFIKMIFLGMTLGIDKDLSYLWAYFLILMLADIFSLYCHLFFCSYLKKSFQAADISEIIFSLIGEIYLGIIVYGYEHYMDYNLLLLLLFPFAISSFLLTKEYRMDGLKESFFPSADLTVYEIKELFYLILRLLDESKNEQELTEIKGMLRNHVRFCFNKECKCRYIQNKERRLMLSVPKTKESTIMQKEYEKVMNAQENHDKIIEGIFEVVDLTLRSYKNQEMAASIEILCAYLNHCRLKRTFAALYHLMLAEDFGLTIFQEFQIYLIRKMAETEIFEEDKRTSASSKIDFDKIVKSHRYYMSLADLILDTTKDFQRFWIQLLKARPELDEIVNIGYGMAIKCQRIEIILECIQDLEINNIKGLMIYGLFQKFIVEDEYEAFQIFQKVKREEDSHHLHHNYLSENGGHSFTNNTAVIIISGNRSTLGTVLNTNNELDQILGIQKSEIIGENVTILMPEIIGCFHNYYIQYYFERQGQKKSYLNERMVFPQHARGYFLPCLIVIRLVPNLNKGVQFMAFLKKVTELTNFYFDEKVSNYEELIMLMIDEEYNIQGINQTAALICTECEEELNIQRYLRNQQKLSLQTLYPEIIEYHKSSRENQLPVVEIHESIQILRNAFLSEIVDTYDEEAQQHFISISSIGKKSTSSFYVVIEIISMNLEGVDL